MGTEGQRLLIHAVVPAADISDPLGDSEVALLRESRDGGMPVMTTLFDLYPFLLRLNADSGYQGPKVQKGLQRACRPALGLRPAHDAEAMPGKDMIPDGH